MIKEIGLYKEKLQSIFTTDDNICNLLLDGLDDCDEFEELQKYVIPHLYIEGAIKDSKSYIMYDIVPKSANKTIKNINILVQVICHKNIIEYKNKPSDTHGLRYDILAQYVESLLCPIDENLIEKRKKQFGIGEIVLDDTDLFLSNEFIGRTFIFSVPDFR